MSSNTNHIITKDNEKFSPANYPNAISELLALNLGISDAPVYYKVEIIVSYLKNHSLQTTWINANPALTRMITTGFFKTSYLETVFESNRNNKVFLTDFEAHISRLLLMRRN